MISFLTPLPIGNAVRVILDPPAGAKLTRVLRKTADTISGPTDAGAGVAYEGADVTFVDIAGLTNGVPYYYKPFYETAPNTWVTAPSVTATPDATANLIGPDPLSLVRERLEAGLKAMVAANEITHTDGYVPCLTAPPTFEAVRFPIVTVHLSGQPRAVSGLGDMVFDDDQDPFTEEWTEYEGAIWAYQINIVAWALNADERLLMRRAVAKVLLGNLAVFNDQALSQVEFSQTDIDDMDSYNVAMHQVVTSFNCQAPLAVNAQVAPIRSVSLTATAP